MFGDIEATPPLISPREARRERPERAVSPASRGGEGGGEEFGCLVAAIGRWLSGKVPSQTPIFGCASDFCPWGKCTGVGFVVYPSTLLVCTHVQKVLTCAHDAARASEITTPGLRSLAGWIEKKSLRPWIITVVDRKKIDPPGFLH